MTRLAAFLLLAAGTSMHAVPDVTPTAPRLELTRCITDLCGGRYSAFVEAVNVDEDGRVRASIGLTKNDLDHGRLHVLQSLSVGESLGVTSRPDRKERRRYSVKLWDLLGSDDPVDFNPQTKLILARRYPDWPIRRCTLVDLPDGPACMGFSEWRAKIAVNEVILEEKGGKRITLRAPNPDSKMPPDRHCTVHGGRIPARLITDVERSLVNANFYLSEADANWKSRNPKVRQLAQEAYRKLLKEYPAESIVVVNLDRIKSRAEAEIED